MAIANFGIRGKVMKITVLPLAIVFLITSCTLDDTTIINDSFYDTVEVWFDHTGPFTLGPRTSRQVGTFGNMARHIRYTPEAFVYFRHNESRSLFIFDNRARFPIHIKNFSTEKVILTIDGWTRPENMSPLPVAGETTMKDAGFIYTRTPQFTAVCFNDGFPMYITPYFDGESFRVSIR